jgi:hypothetical protein
MTGATSIKPLESYGPERGALEALFTPERVEQCWPRLTEIHEYTEAIWWDYVSRLPERRVKYLLLAEAPPWSEAKDRPKGRPAYALDPVPSKLLSIICAAFKCHHMLPADALHWLPVERGFLLLDTIPFSMQYESKLRDSDAYDELVRVSAQSYLRHKLEASGLSFSSDPKVAFLLTRHGRSAKTVLWEPLASGVICKRGWILPKPESLQAAFGLPET